MLHAIDQFLGQAIPDETIKFWAMMLSLTATCYGFFIGYAILDPGWWKVVKAVHKYGIGFVIAGAIIASNSLSSLIELFF